VAEPQSRAFARASRRLATTTFDALQNGAKRNIEMFNRLGISQKELGDLSNDQVALFDRVAGALGKLSSDTERAAIGTALLGRNYTELLPALKDGAFESAAEEVGRFGLALSQQPPSRSSSYATACRDLGTA
jgi:hypothetical protein